MTLKSTFGAIMTALVIVAPGSGYAQSEGTEKCYGVARAGENDGIGETENPGSATLDYQGDAWKRVPAGTCLTMALPQQTDGTPRRGSLHPLKRDLP